MARTYESFESSFKILLCNAIEKRDNGFVLGVIRDKTMFLTNSMVIKPSLFETLFQNNKDYIDRFLEENKEFKQELVGDDIYIEYVTKLGYSVQLDYKDGLKWTSAYFAGNEAAT